MKQLRLRFADKSEAKDIVELLNRNPHNQFDPDVLSYPTLQVLCAYDGDKVVAYLPIHNVKMMESIAVDPEASDLMKAQALRDLTKAAGLLASGQGIKEVLFLGGHGGVGDMATHKGHTFVELPFKVFRQKL